MSFDHGTTTTTTTTTNQWNTTTSTPSTNKIRYSRGDQRPCYTPTKDIVSARRVLWNKEIVEDDQENRGVNENCRRECRRICAFGAKGKAYYQILGVDPNAFSPTLVSERFKILARLVHPDKCKSDESTEAFRILHEAYTALSKRTSCESVKPQPTWAQLRQETIRLERKCASLTAERDAMRKELRRLREAKNNTAKNTVSCNERDRSDPFGLTDDDVAHFFTSPRTNSRTPPRRRSTEFERARRSNPRQRPKSTGNNSNNRSSTLKWPKRTSLYGSGIARASRTERMMCAEHSTAFGGPSVRIRFDPAGVGIKGVRGSTRKPCRRCQAGVACSQSGKGLPGHR